ncbi:hypothetical protein JV35_08200 [Pectobacterium betavasculorum]|uniref:Integrase n=1 Tax=Pectobacterium betavasculorum TaxID=55207 RepID=A0ABR4V1N3_9GAMM|nr:hypothetical protein JV35_08200 [Pectobacterium betavasculorum]
MESGLWAQDVVERQMSHQERNSVRAAYIHKAEYLDARKVMMQWWSDYPEKDMLRHTFMLNGWSCLTDNTVKSSS